MNKLPFFLLTGLAIISSCSRDARTYDTVPEVPSYSITEDSIVSADDLLRMARNPLVSFIPSSFFDGEIRSAIGELRPNIQAFRNDGINIRRVNFTYASVDRLGSPVTLSAHMCYPVSESGSCTLGSITLYSHIMTPDDSFIPTRFFCIEEFRVFHNAAVVIPDFQGSGASLGAANNYAAPVEDARQSIEALLIAKDIISKDNHAVLAGQFHTDNIGISRGALVAYAVQKYIESCPNRGLVKAVNLKGTFAAEVNPFFFQRFKAMSVPGTYLNRTGWYNTISSAYDLYPEYMEGLEFSDFFNDEFNSRQVVVGGKTISMKDALSCQQWNLLEQMAAWGIDDSGNAYDILNPEFCNSDGTLNESSRQWKALSRVADVYDYIPTWRLKYPLTIGMHTNDYMFSFSDVNLLVEDLRSRTDQEVKLVSCDFTVPLLDDPTIIHAMAAFYWMFYTARRSEL